MESVDIFTVSLLHRLEACDVSHLDDGGLVGHSLGVGNSLADAIVVMVAILQAHRRVTTSALPPALCCKRRLHAEKATAGSNSLLTLEKQAEAVLAPA
eukprot:1156584-Pelagomonas_calceolata.AAC.3